MKSTKFNKIIIFITIFFIGISFYNFSQIKAYFKISNSETYGIKNESTTIEKNLRLGNQRYIESVLIDIFGSKSNSIVKLNITNSSAAFGGPCDIYEQVRIGDGFDAFADPDLKCQSGKYSSNLPMYGTPNILREAKIIKTCELLTKNHEILMFPLSKIFQNKEITSPNIESLLMAYNMFNPEKFPKNNFLESLIRFNLKESNNFKKWASIFYILCIDPGWQII